MRFMALVKATKDSEAGVMPTETLLREMGKFNEELVKAGVMQAGDGLHPSSKGARISFRAGKPTVTDGPFAETKELVAGYWVWSCKSLAEAKDWLKRAPFDDADVEIRQIFSPEDFGAAMMPQVREQQDRIRAEMEIQGRAKK